MKLQCGSRTLDLSRPVIMGVLNVTPDSFFDGGRFVTVATALAHARHMAEAGASIIDIGAESTRPGAAAVSVQEELDRLLPVVEAVSRELDVVISVDTSSPAVMRESARRGAGFINDIRALQRDGAVQAVLETGLPVCLQHMQGEPGTMQAAPHYDDVVAEVKAFLRQKKSVCIQAGIPAENILLDPGFGFGKTLAHNLALLDQLAELRELGALLVGLSRKSMLGAILNDAPVDKRLYAGVAAAAIAALNGASIIRTHDVRETADAVAVATAVLKNRKEP